MNAEVKKAAERRGIDAKETVSLKFPVNSHRACCEALGCELLIYTFNPQD
jgi:hypothetical protein